ncbi:hypothetical protein GCM10010275_13210 [Streptomyces litmocidini]|nr:hypothetical protein GCM10010275_13210 [Streptomyces litmocidini]
MTLTGIRSSAPRAIGQNDPRRKWGAATGAGSLRFASGFRRGCRQDSPRVSGGARQGSVGFPQGPGRLPSGSRHGSVEIPGRLRHGSDEIPAEFLRASGRSSPDRWM